MENLSHAGGRPERLSFEDLEGAREYIREQWSKGVRPVVTVPEEYATHLQHGLAPHATWIPDVEVIAATFGRDPYLPQGGGRRVVVEVNVPPEMIEPRFTGPGKDFQGVVVLSGPIPPDSITVVH